MRCVDPLEVVAHPALQRTHAETVALLEVEDRRQVALADPRGLEEVVGLGPGVPARLVGLRVVVRPRRDRPRSPERG